MLDGKKIIAFICECNPFHEGHKRLIYAAKKEGDIVIAVMSGNFVQRGEPAIYDKYDRAKQLLKNGVSMVIELPVEATLSSARYFAETSIRILNKLGFVDKIIFGSSIANIDKLSELADINIKSSNNENIKTKLKTGYTYSKALSSIYSQKLTSNDILAVEYISAIKRIKSKISCSTIKRVNDIPTASELRSKLKKTITNDSFSSILNYKILLAKNNLLDLNNIYLMTDDISNSILKLQSKNQSFESICKSLKTKNRTLASVKRVLLNIVLDIDKCDVENVNHFPKYIRVLGVKKTFLPYIKNIKIPYLLSFTPSSYNTFIKNFPRSKQISKNKNGSFIVSNSIAKNIFANNLYNLYSSNNKLESTTKVLIV